MLVLSCRVSNRMLAGFELIENVRVGQHIAFAKHRTDDVLIERKWFGEPERNSSRLSRATTIIADEML